MNLKLRTGTFFASWLNLFKRLILLHPSVTISRHHSSIINLLLTLYFSGLSCARLVSIEFTPATALNSSGGMDR
jgi:hypothetical protein